MISALSPNTQAILLLTAPLLAGGGAVSPDLLTPGEYRRLARRLRELQRRPADLLSSETGELLRDCHAIIEENRLQRLLSRGFLLSQVIERWRARAIWVISRADADYPRRLRERLKEDAPAVLYGCGDITLLNNGGLAVVGSRQVAEALIDYTLAIGQLAARAGMTLVSGGAKGIDQAAVRGAVESGGRAVVVLADSLEKSTVNRDHRNMIIDERLALISPYDPGAGFTVGNAMQRNKVIYALADAALVVNSDVDKGGTWAGALEQLTRFRSVPVYVRSTGEPSEGLDALRARGALSWPNPLAPDELAALSDYATTEKSSETQAERPLFSHDSPVADDPLPPSPVDREHEAGYAGDTAVKQSDVTPADALFAAVREVLPRLLTTPMSDADIAVALDVSTPQAKAWLQRLVDDGKLEKLSKPVRYVVKAQTSLLDFGTEE